MSRLLVDFWWVPVIAANVVLDVMLYLRQRRDHREFIRRFRDEFGPKVRP